MCLLDFIKEELRICSRGSCDIATIICGSFGLAFNFLIILFVILKITCCPEDNHFIFSALYAYTIGFAVFAGFMTIPTVFHGLVM
ncbi:unnamed protein product [Adineta ricciae]|uniref:Uncharacterized protein n=1 Tax=Adineta ricciae TaxID=249248 RepID=A0A815J9K9_ADIRI|nr:unnamed protein product [Adineta ricciae]